ncbi:MAG TPA: helix-turn-helix transcriptional regulator, partial [Candidatus Acidoferrales bacterium]|nr:helix-turn-helix transcriptional regulator [Candidatus Acidoferrales bacterium]
MGRDKSRKPGAAARSGADPIADPIGERIRERRTSMGLSLQELARRVETSPSHIFHIENGEKVPNEDLAARVARALGEDQDVFRAWARVRQRTDFYTAAASADVVRRYLGTRPGSASSAAYAPAQESGAGAEGRMLRSPGAPEAGSPAAAEEFVRPEIFSEAAA